MSPLIKCNLTCACNQVITSKWKSQSNYFSTHNLIQIWFCWYNSYKTNSSGNCSGAQQIFLTKSKYWVNIGGFSKKTISWKLADQDNAFCLRHWRWKVAPFQNMIKVLKRFNETFQAKRSYFEEIKNNWFDDRWVWSCGLQGEEDKMSFSLRGPSMPQKYLSNIQM